MTQRVALVTGAMGGLGTAICQELAKAGNKVVASYHPQFDNKDAWLAEMAAAGFNDFVCVAGDVSSLEDCQKMVAEAEAAAGPIDILINNAGITPVSYTHLEVYKRQPEHQSGWKQAVEQKRNDAVDEVRLVERNEYGHIQPADGNDVHAAIMHANPLTGLGRVCRIQRLTPNHKQRRDWP